MSQAPLVFVCTTCARAETGAADSRGRQLARALHATLAGGADPSPSVREVACLNGCPSPCNVALRGARRWTYRFSHCTLQDVDALLAVAREYWRTPRGKLAAWMLPPSLRDKVSACTPPPG